MWGQKDRILHAASNERKLQCMDDEILMLLMYKYNTGFWFLLQFEVETEPFTPFSHICLHCF